MVDCMVGILSSTLNPLHFISEAGVSPGAPRSTQRPLRFFGVTAPFYMKKGVSKNKPQNDKRYLELQEQFNKLNQQQNEEQSSSLDADIPEDCKDTQKNVFQIQFKKSDATDYPSNKFVVTGLDFVNYVSAEDIYVLCNSFLPQFGQIQSVSVYQSNYGRKQIFDEQRNGPNFDRFIEAAFNQVIKQNQKVLKQYIKLQQSNNDKNAIIQELMDSDLEFSKIVSDQKLNLYNNDRLTWYIAIVIFDSPQTAETVYNQIDGQEYESLGQYIHCSELTDDVYEDLIQQDKFDIPESKGGYLQATCTQLPLKYQSYTNHVQYTSSKVVFDEADGDRKKFFKLMKQGIDVTDEKVSKYLNLNSSSSEESDDNRKDDYSNDNKKQLEMARKFLLYGDNKTDDSSDKDDNSSESSSSDKKVPFQVNFESTFDQKVASTTNNQQQYKTDSNKIEWQYRAGAEKSGPIVKKNEEKIASLSTKNFFKKILKHIEREDNPHMIRNLNKKKENLIKQYPSLRDLDRANEKPKAEYDDRFDNIDDMM